MTSSASNRGKAEMALRVLRLISLLAAAGMLTACATRSPVTPPVATHDDATAGEPSPLQRTDADALIRRGCFTCLERAFDQAQRQNDRRRAFEAAALLAMRARELGMPDDDWLMRVRELAAGDVGATMALDAASALRRDPLSGVRDAVLNQTPQRLRAETLMPQWPSYGDPRPTIISTPLTRSSAATTSRSPGSAAPSLVIRTTRHPRGSPSTARV